MGQEKIIKETQLQWYSPWLGVNMYAFDNKSYTRNQAYLSITGVFA